MNTTKLAKLYPCHEAIKWVRDQKNQQQAWEDCDRGDWMLWLCGKLSGKPGSYKRKKLVLTSCECARLSLKYVKKGEIRPLKAIETAEKWVKGKATIEEVRDAAYAAASASAYAADYAAYAAASASAYAAAADAYAAASAASYAATAATTATTTAATAAYAASYAAAADADASDASDAAQCTALKRCADIVRKHYPNVPKL